ncbi:hypothetical protein FOA52_011345 [Chlamydomonas sp. UWO 241]|nr:hypothetical protein FOA52_011345 [Chlamydomonas sp. UWO 241]
MSLAGGPGAIVSQSEHVRVRYCCFPAQEVDGVFLRRCKQGTLQFVILKPIFTLISLILFAAGVLHVGNFSPAHAYLWMLLALNATYSLALFSLLQFYRGTRELLNDYHPGVKFLLIKVGLGLGPEVWAGGGVWVLGLGS